MKTKALRWARELALYLLLAIVITTATDIYRSQNAPMENTPELVGYDQNGEMVDVVAMSYESPVVVYFWATWCSVCRFVSPTVDWVSQYYPVIAVSGASGSTARVDAFKAEKGYQFTNINDEDSSLFRQWGITVTPTILIVKDGSIQSVTTGITTPPGLLARLWLNQ
jgi:thiol-disulfide isomerase/thioredoxin